jgi:deoxyribodipyrimidine photo-lyase
MATASPVLVWFRDDLRLTDNPALRAAAKSGDPLVCLYVLDEKSPGLRPFGAASRWWLAQSLHALEADLKKRGAQLVLRRGAAATVVPKIAQDIGAKAVHFNRRFERAGIAADEAVTTKLKDLGIGGTSHSPNLLAEPKAIATNDGKPMRVFTPFWRKLRALDPGHEPIPAPKTLKAGPKIVSDDLASWSLEPTKPDWAGGLRDAWTPGEHGARERLHDFLGQMKHYTEERDRPDKASTSRLSPHLRFGELSINEVFHAARFAADEGRAPLRDVEKFQAELAWREFSSHLLFHFPDLATTNLQSRFDHFPWRKDKVALRAWQKGQTGYPIVDAGMRQLWTTGWMHNRVRMIVASFLVKHLLIDWRDGEAWFWDTLVDADPANNPASWQWVAGSGADAAPYFRIFNPTLQGTKFDPNASYVREWVPELAKLPDDVIHTPWLADTSELKKAGVVLGKTYREPIVDHAMARKRALEAFAKTKS